MLKREGVSLLGRDWLKEIKLEWKEIFRIQNSELEQILRKHKDLFGPGLGTYKGPKAKLVVDPEVSPKYCKARSIQ